VRHACRDTDDGPAVHLDLFAGPGGWDQGLASLGVTDVVGIEIDGQACATAAAAGHRRIRADVAAYPTAPFVGKVDGLIASPPCQSFSSAGSKGGQVGADLLVGHALACAGGWRAPTGLLADQDVRADLTLQPLRWAWDLKPRWVACEQVPEVLPIWRAIAVTLGRWGYRTWVGRVNAADHGVPQTRQRVFLLARRDGGPVGPPATSHYDAAGGLSLFDASHGGGQTGWRTPVDALDPDVGGWRLLIDRRQMYVDGVYTLAPVDGAVRPSPTITGAAFGKHVWVCHLPDFDRLPGRLGWAFDRVADHPDGGLRASMTPAAAGLLQGFPVDYPWQGSRQQAHQQAGDAVPPPMAAAVLADVAAGARAADVA
jgi:DNA (cytosine-5)-methyltransferase 1